MFFNRRDILFVNGLARNVPEARSRGGYGQGNASDRESFPWQFTFQEELNRQTSHNRRDFPKPRPSILVQLNGG